MREPAGEDGQPEVTSMPAGLYIHVPFCSSVCPYCDFAVLIAGQPRRQGWVAGIAEEADRYGGLGWSFDTVYLGGGTPSSLALDQLAAVIEGVRSTLDVQEGAQLFLEANPEDVTERAVEGWRDLGVHTVSLGLQSLDDEALRVLGRRHDRRGGREAYETLRRGGFASVSVDLIYGRPGQDAASWQRELGDAVALAPDHLSCYQLTVHGGTVFGRRLARGRLHELDEDTQAELFLLTHRALGDAGYEGYEVSNFAATPEHRSRHNQKYWRHEPYLGLGPSAHSFSGTTRWWNIRKLRLWQAALDSGRSPREGEEELSAADLAFEAVMLGLRTAEGVDLAALRERLGIDLAAVNRVRLEQWDAAGLITLEGGRVRPTLEGLAVAEALAREVEVPGA